jgi:hypothetical protein
VRHRITLVLTLLVFVVAMTAGAASAATLPYFEGFNSADVATGVLPTGWTLLAGDSGEGNFWHDQINPQAISVSSAINPSLVTFPDSGSLPSALEGDGAAWFGEASTGTYCGNDSGNSFNDVAQTASGGCTSEQTESGNLDSPQLSLTSQSNVNNGSLTGLYASAQLAFQSWWDIEAVAGQGFDVMTISYSIDTDHTTWTELGKLNPDQSTDGQPQEDFTSGGGIEVPPVWQPYLIDLGPVLTAIKTANAPAGIPPGDPTDSVELRFNFDTNDDLYNGFRGWLLDQVSATQPYTAGSPTAASVSPSCVSPEDLSSIITLHGSAIPLGSTVVIDAGTPNAQTIAATAAFEPSDTEIQFTNPGLTAGAHTFEIVTPSGVAGNQIAFTSSDPCGRATSTAVSCSPASLTFGGSTTCTASVSDADGGTPAPPTGTVTFTGAAAGNCALAPVANAGGDTINTPTSNCQATLRPSVGGTTPETATYSGDSTFGPSTGSTTLAITPTAPAVTPGAPVVHGQGAGFSGSVIPNGLETSAHFEYGLDPKYSGGGPVVYTNVTPAVALGAGSTTVAVSQSVSGLVPNALYHVRLIASNSAGTGTGADQTFTTAKLPNPPPPTLGKTENATPISGLVLIKLPAGKGSHAAGGVVKGKGFIPLTQARQIPVGSQIDARRGTLNLVVATTKKRHTNTARLGGGVFSLAQQRSGPAKGLSTLALLENAFSGAPSYSTCTAKKGKSVLAGIAKLSPKILQTLSVSDKNGKFRTKGRYSAATERGTFWETQDRCDGTLTIVKRGTVNVQDFRTRKTIIVHAGHRFLATAAITKPKPKKKK